MSSETGEPGSSGPTGPGASSTGTSGVDSVARCSVVPPPVPGGFRSALATPEISVRNFPTWSPASVMAPMSWVTRTAGPLSTST